ncbi:hypothetical protein OOZ19_03185 [Saccharopolyspora sp. NFXS83]|uniref:cyanobactin maturation protease PatG family protein n=1 Tax=Saccharopolyspora sp. NFXS83 TaxID=2993560 RepID=UPI00224A4BDA|nr:hypothetical protein [Saccharopolyspora sp. NFXS83]MCX2729231.1 hypothetical protein [Saccharopolyspora sp. NFXS83]
MDERELPPQAVESPAGARGGAAARPRDPMPSRQAHECAACGRGDVVASGENGRDEFSSPYVYALGRVEPRLPSLGVEKEFAQVIGQADTADLTDREALHAVLAEPRNRYLARHLCYVFTVRELETYVVRPHESGDLPLLVEALRAAPRSTDLHALIGVRGPLAPPDLCNGLMIPVVTFDQIYSFDAGSLVRSLPKPDGVAEEPFRSAAEELFERVMHLADNAGSSDEHRALNYLVVRYPSVYAKTAEAFAEGASLTAIETRPSRLSGRMRTILDVIFSYTGRTTDVTEKFFVRVDVTEEFPFLVTKLSPYYDR